MKKKQNNESLQLTKSQQKRQQRQHELQAAKRKALISRIALTSVSVVIVAGIAAMAGISIYHKLTATKADGNYSKLLSENGTITGIDVKSLVTMPDFTTLTVPLSEVEYTDDQVEVDITSQLESHKEPNSSPSLTVADKDTVNIDYVGSVDGVAFEGGDTKGSGTELVIGSNSYVDDFEQQLIGSHPGDKLTVKVTFPADYENAELAGKDAEFNVTVNSILELPEFTDEFAAANLSEFASTAQGYRDYLKSTNYDKNLTAWLQTYITNNAALSSAPKEYINHLKAVKKYDDELTFESYKEMMKNYAGSDASVNFSDFTGMNDKDYENSLAEYAQKKAAEDMTYQAIFEQNSLTISDDEYKNKLTHLGETAESDYGKGYVMQQLIKDKVTEYLIKTVKVGS